MASYFGGTAQLRINGTLITIRTMADIEPASLTATTITNSDGTGSQTLKPDIAKWDITLVDADDAGNPLDWNSLMTSRDMSVSYIEQLTGVVHMLSNAFFEGRPKVNRETGEVTGLSIRGQYSVIKR